MTDPMFRLMELFQKIDTSIATERARRFADPREIAALGALRQRLKDALVRTTASRLRAGPRASLPLPGRGR